MATTSQLSDLHLHFQGCIQPADMLAHLAKATNIDWEWYETSYKAAYGVDSSARSLVERFKNGDQSVIGEFEQLAVFGDNDAGNFSRFLAKSNLFWAGSYRNDDPKANEQELLDFASAIKKDFTKHRISYAELRMTGADPALLRMLDSDKNGVTIRLAVSLDRKNPWEGWKRVQEMALGEHGESLTAIDFCNVEEGYPPKNLIEFFDTVEEFNRRHPERALAILYHVGESFNDKSLESAIRWVQEAAEMGAHRLGHAIALGVDPTMYGEHTRRERVSERKDQIAYDLKHKDGLRKFGVNIEENALNDELQKLAALADDSIVEIQYDERRLEEVRRRQGYAIECVRSTGAVIEVCPTSNLRIGGITDQAYHPVHRFLAENLPIVVASDDPGMFGVTLNDEINWVVDNVRGVSNLRDILISNAYHSRSEVLAGREKNIMR